jgi:hypothetical protein
LPLATEMKSAATQLGAAETRRTFSWVELIVVVGVFGFLWSVLHFRQGATAHFDESQSPQIATARAFGRATHPWRTIARFGAADLPALYKVVISLFQ